MLVQCLALTRQVYLENCKIRALSRVVEGMVSTIMAAIKHELAGAELASRAGTFP